MNGPILKRFIAHPVLGITFFVVQLVLVLGLSVKFLKFHMFPVSVDEFFVRIEMPMGTRDELSSRKYSVGPSGVFVYKHQDWIVGGLVNWLFSFSGTDNREDVNRMSFQYFVTWSGLPDHWQLNMSPTITYDRKAKGGNAWAVPIGLGAGKMVKLGKLPVKVQAEYNYYVVHPDDFGPRHLFTLKITPVIPALIKKPLF